MKQVINKLGDALRRRFLLVERLWHWAANCPAIRPLVVIRGDVVSRGGVLQLGDWDTVIYGNIVMEQDVRFATEK